MKYSTRLFSQRKFVVQSLCCSCLISLTRKNKIQFFLYHEDGQGKQKQNPNNFLRSNRNFSSIQNSNNWKEQENSKNLQITEQKNFFIGLGFELGINIPENWKQLDVEKVVERGGGDILKLYGNSLLKALQNIFPDHHWKLWRFDQVSKELWEDVKNHREYFDWVGKELGVQKLEDWYQIQTKQLEGEFFRHEQLTNHFLRSNIHQTSSCSLP